MPTETYLPLVTREFSRLKRLAEAAISQLSEAAFFVSPAPDDNSVAVLVKHMAGNLKSRFTDFLTTDGEKPGRDRDAEFEIAPEESRADLMTAWEAGWNALFTALGPLSESDLTRIVTIRGEPLTVLQAINRQLTHYAYHVGQIVFLAKHHCGPAWHTLSIPRGASAAFNREPTSYLSDR